MRITRNIVQTAAKLGADPAQLMANVGLDPAVLDDPETRVPAYFHRELLNEGIRLTGDRSLGIHAGESLEPDPADVIWYIFLNCKTVREAALRSGRYYMVISDVAHPELHEDANEARIAMVTAVNPPVWPPQAAEYTLAIWANMLRKLGGKRLQFRVVRFQHSHPGDISEHLRFFRAQPVFDQPNNELVLDPSMLDLPNAFETPDLHLLQMLTGYVEQQLATMSLVTDFIDQMRRGIAETLRVGEPPTLKEVARTLGIGARSLQRRLKERETSFSDQLDAVRRNFATVYPRESQSTLYEIAYLLGYSSPEAFYRAFRRWKGVTPAEYRRGAPGTAGKSTAGSAILGG